MRTLLVIAATAIALVSCGGGGDGPAIDNSGPQVLSPGQSVVLGAGQTVMVPATTTVHDPVANNTIVINGNHNTVHTSAGSQVTVPATATGAADNTVTNP
jgi:hypothetical protein